MKNLNSIFYQRCGLLVFPSTEMDALAIMLWEEKSNYVGEYDAVENVFMFEETPDTIDQLELELAETFEFAGINAQFESHIA